MSKLLEIAVTGSLQPGHWHAQIRAGACSACGGASPPLEAISLTAPGSAQYKIASRFLEAGIALLAQKSLNTVVRLLDISALCRLVLQLPKARIRPDSGDGYRHRSPLRLIAMPAQRATPRGNA